MEDVYIAKETDEKKKRKINVEMSKKGWIYAIASTARRDV